MFQKFISNTTVRKYFAIDNKQDEVHCKLQNYICLLKRTHCGVQYESEGITPLNPKMNIHKRGKSGCEISIDHYRNVCENAIFSIQVIENLPGNSYENGIKDNATSEYQLQLEDYWMKTLHTVYPYGLNERT